VQPLECGVNPDLNSNKGVALQTLSLFYKLKAKSPLIFRLTGFLNVAGRMGRVWALVLFNKIAIKVMYCQN